MTTSTEPNVTTNIDMKTKLTDFIEDLYKRKNVSVENTEVLFVILSNTPSIWTVTPEIIETLTVSGIKFQYLNGLTESIGVDDPSVKVGHAIFGRQACLPGGLFKDIHIVVYPKDLESGRFKYLNGVLSIWNIETNGGWDIYGKA